MKKRLLYVFAIVLMCIFIFVKLPAADLYIRIYFEDNETIMEQIKGGSCTLFYTTDTSGAFSQEQMLTSEIDYDEYKVEFKLTSDLENHIQFIRLDLPGEEQLIGIKNITISSGGVIKKQYNPCEVFHESNVVHANDIYAMDLATARGIVYIGTLSQDPYIVLSETISQELMNHYNHFYIIRLIFCCFIIGCVVFPKNIFRKEEAVTAE